MVRVERTANLSVLLVLMLMKMSWLVIAVQSKVTVITIVIRNFIGLRMRYVNAQLTPVAQVLPI